MNQQKNNIIFYLISEMGALLWKIVQTLGQLKFAVVIILLFAFSLGFGTIVESTASTDYAQRLVYKSWPFFALQALMFLSILSATLLRLNPFRSHLAGFYVLHLGLLLLFIGSLVTFYWGIDAQITLQPTGKNKTLETQRELLLIHNPQTKETAELILPFSALPAQLNLNYQQWTVKNYLPFADETLTWVPQAKGASSATYRVQNPMVSQEFTLSLSPNSDFQSTESMGPLTVHYLPAELYECLERDATAQYILWQQQLGLCFSEHHPWVKKVSSKPLGFKLSLPEQASSTTLNFNPELSPLPLLEGNGTEGGGVDQNSPWRLFNKTLFSQSPQLLLFGRHMAYFDRDQQQWQFAPLTEKTAAPLPWMGFELTLLKEASDQIPTYQPIPRWWPKFDGKKLVTGKFRYLELEIASKSGQKKNLWLKLNDQHRIKVDGIPYEVSFGPAKEELPMELELARFHMNYDPGTKNPASYESYVDLLPLNEKNTAAQRFHLYMNHPLKYDRYTFYQASYFQTEQGTGSILSVNYDPGRWIKYLGSLLLVLGSLWHFAFRHQWSRWKQRFAKGSPQ